MQKVVITLLVVVGFSFGVYISGQSSFTITPGGTLALCPAPSAKALIHCNVAGDPSNADGDYVSANGAPYFQLQKAGTGGVNTVFGRAGNVVAAPGDYSYSQLTAPPTKISCSSATHSPSGFVASGCVIN
jgi:hypothetical protein